MSDKNKKEQVQEVKDFIDGNIAAGEIMQNHKQYIYDAIRKGKTARGAVSEALRKTGFVEAIKSLKEENNSLQTQFTNYDKNDQSQREQAIAVSDKIFLNNDLLDRFENYTAALSNEAKKYYDNFHKKGKAAKNAAKNDEVKVENIAEEAVAEPAINGETLVNNVEAEDVAEENIVAREKLKTDEGEESIMNEESEVNAEQNESEFANDISEYNEIFDKTVEETGINPYEIGNEEQEEKFWNAFEEKVLNSGLPLAEAISFEDRVIENGLLSAEETNEEENGVTVPAEKVSDEVIEEATKGDAAKPAEDKDDNNDKFKLEVLSKFLDYGNFAGWEELSGEDAKKFESAWKKSAKGINFANVSRVEQLNDFLDVLTKNMEEQGIDYHGVVDNIVANLLDNITMDNFNEMLANFAAENGEKKENSTRGLIPAEKVSDENAEEANEEQNDETVPAENFVDDKDEFGLTDDDWTRIAVRVGDTPKVEEEEVKTEADAEAEKTEVEEELDDTADNVDEADIPTEEGPVDLHDQLDEIFKITLDETNVDPRTTTDEDARIDFWHIFEVKALEKGIYFEAIDYENEIMGAAEENENDTSDTDPLSRYMIEQKELHDEENEENENNEENKDSSEESEEVVDEEESNEKETQKEEVTYKPAPFDNFINYAIDRIFFKSRKNGVEPDLSIENIAKETEQGEIVEDTIKSYLTNVPGAIEKANKFIREYDENAKIQEYEAPIKKMLEPDHKEEPEVEQEEHEENFEIKDGDKTYEFNKEEMDWLKFSGYDTDKKILGFINENGYDVVKLSLSFIMEEAKKANEQSEEEKGV